MYVFVSQLLILSLVYTHDIVQATMSGPHTTVKCLQINNYGAATWKTYIGWDPSHAQVEMTNLHEAFVS